MAAMIDDLAITENVASAQHVDHSVSKWNKHLCEDDYIQLKKHKHSVARVPEL